MHVIATAGHVDHGKSTLIRALTGMEPDRWAEEQRRGMTIDLGYAWTTLNDGSTIAFVDVPGHQRFVSNMLAGVGPVPAVLFVVAADQGWSAQSAEHLEILDALKVRHGVLAVTRADLADAELAIEEARDYLKGTSLEKVEACPVSPVAGTGLHELRAALARMTAELPDAVGGRTRLWIDRVFTIRGAGTVVTGTLSSGTIRSGDQLQIHPSGELVRIRGIESLKQEVEEVHGVARVALNLRGVKPSDVRRGDALTEPGGWLDVSVMDVRLSEIEHVPGQLALHMGSTAVRARVRPLGIDTVRLTLDRPIVTAIGERGVLRDPAAQRVVAAATVLDPMPPPLQRRGAAKRRAEVLDEVSGEADLPGEVRRRGAVRKADLALVGIDVETDAMPEHVVSIGEWLIEDSSWERWREGLSGVVDEWAAAHALLPGTPRQVVVDKLALPDVALVDELVERVEGLVVDGEGVHRRGQEAFLSPEVEQALEALIERLDADAFDVPEAPELADAGLSDKVLAVAVKGGKLVRVAGGIYLRPGAFDEAVRRLAALDQPFAMTEARQALGTTRRVALPLLEQLDRTRRTVRVDSQLRMVREV